MRIDRHKPVGQHVIVNLNGGWSVEQGDKLKATRRFKTEAEAGHFSLSKAEEDRGAVYFHAPDGSVRDRVAF